MGALTIQPLSVLQENVSENPAPQGASAAPSTDANVAQSGGAPQDTVILTGKGAETQLSGRDPNGSQAQQTALFFAVQNIFLGQDNTEGGGNPQQVQAPPLQAETPGAPQQTADTATNGANNAAANSSSSTPQQQLATLDQTLQELGINPQSISLFNRMALLLYASDPAALRVIVQGLQGAVQKAGQTGSSNSTANASQPAPAQAQVPPQQSGSSGASVAQSNGAANTYQGLQYNFAGTAIQNLQSQQSDNSVPPDTDGQGINITV